MATGAGKVMMEKRHLRAQFDHWLFLYPGWPITSFCSPKGLHHHFPPKNKTTNKQTKKPHSCPWLFWPIRILSYSTSFLRFPLFLRLGCSDAPVTGRSAGQCIEMLSPTAGKNCTRLFFWTNTSSWLFSFPATPNQGRFLSPTQYPLLCFWKNSFPPVFFGTCLLLPSLHT